MDDVISKVMKINLRARSRDRVDEGEGIDSICFAVDDMDRTEAALAERGIEFARRQNFNGNDVAFVRPGDACGISLEFIQGPATDKATSET